MSNDPLKIMDVIESSRTMIDSENGEEYMDIDMGDWQSLRATIEAQAEELAQAKKGWETTSEYAKGCGETIAMLQEELAQARARIARLQKIIEGLRLALGGEANRIEHEAKESGQ